MGRTAQAVGAAFELWLAAEHEKALRLGIIAQIEKTEPHSKVINGRLQFEKPGIADFVGVLDRSGKTVAIEAKSTSEDYLARSAIEPKQAKHLEAVARAGGLALLLVEYRMVDGRKHHAAIPWLEVPWKVKVSAESVSEVDVGKWIVVVDEKTCYLSPFHPGGPRSSAHLDRRRVFARE